MTTEQPTRRVTELDLKELKEAKASAAFKRSNAHDKHNDAKAAMSVTKADVDYWDKEYGRLESELATATERYHQELADRLNEQEGRRKQPSAFQKSQGGLVADDPNGASMTTTTGGTIAAFKSPIGGDAQSERGKLSPDERAAATDNGEKGLAPAIEKGDFVMHVLGGPKMQVVEVAPGLGNPSYRCSWAGHETEHGEWFSGKTVIFVERPPPQRTVIDDPHANVPRRKFNDLTPAEQEAAEQIDGDANPRWKLPSGELVDSNLADGKQTDAASVAQTFAAQDKPAPEVDETERDERIAREEF